MVLASLFGPADRSSEWPWPLLEKVSDGVSESVWPSEPQLRVGVSETAGGEPATTCFHACFVGGVSATTSSSSCFRRFCEEDGLLLPPPEAGVNFGRRLVSRGVCSMMYEFLLFASMPPPEEGRDLRRAPLVPPLPPPPPPDDCMGVLSTTAVLLFVSGTLLGVLSTPPPK